MENIVLKHDRKITIAVGKSRHDLKWKNVSTNWSKLLSKLSITYRTYETMAQYAAWPKSKQDEVKDIGGFVAGSLKEGRRKNGYVESRSILTLDVDFAYPDFMEDFKLTCSFAMCAYSTHKHKPTSPRLRLLIPLDRDATPDEYEAIARLLASDYGMDLFDDTTFQPARLMYWPSTSKDAEYYFDYIDAPFLKADEVLARYTDWQDTSYWPESSRASSIRKSTADKQGDPLTKEGLIGAFCRTYTIQEVIEKFLSDVYAPCNSASNRYTYLGGSTAGGLVIYDDRFAYSNHGTDPAGGLLCNAFDLVRIHKFKDLDLKAKPDVKPSDLPSWKAMMTFASGDEETKKTLGEEATEKAFEYFKDVLDDEHQMEQKEKNDSPELQAVDTDWMKELSVTKRGVYESTINNLVLILKNDPLLHGLGRLNLFSGRKEVEGKLPWKRSVKVWTDADDAALRMYIEKVYNNLTKNNLADAVTNTFNSNSYHPVRSYLESLKWDGVKRVDTIIIDYLGANNTPTNREITRKTLVAAVSRIYEPGCKFDYMTTLVGPQGVGKSTLFQKLGKNWFSDTLTDIRGKEAYEALDGVWILEMGELNALKKADREAIKSYISKREDTYRKAFDHHVSVNKRQCIFVGTTNEVEFLSDPTGNRRFWIIEINASLRKYSVWEDLTPEIVDQIWAEAVQIYQSGQECIMRLSDEAAKNMARAQEEHTAENPYFGTVQRFLETAIPVNWYTLTIQEQMTWFSATEEYREDLSKDTLIERDRVCALEIWCVAFQKDKASFTRAQAQGINECLSKSIDWSKASTARYGEYGIQRGYLRRFKANVK